MQFNELISEIKPVCNKHLSTIYIAGPLINLIKWVLKYYLEVILYNCV